MTNYQIGDFLIRIKNASMAGIKEVTFFNSGMVLEVAKALKSEGFIDSIEVNKKNITIKLSIFNKKPVLSNIKIVSKPGLRIYMNVEKIESYHKPDILILTTPKGIMSGKRAKKERVGGELIAKVI
ncbi:30S ribosomal protein S8 [Candidatus Woesebacteria bacterium GWC2_33_12]|uniref:Small ribosomal subunit protein uS8 n=1 Tax=Candidatus Woesebacteria bacterium GW2011_GWB1_33_22 TaxID=1618566 RepID=A0A0G0C125_9BACT|nr:MAG: 30S ribosomal protein S8 [Candidatus Woesebacteria bacterium GW2011_GWC2_33_12]KKP42176.1 MAG: 30S ribosomal protein S8 [Candidatus Woesebacteria bacterium GW2011_GWA2_33_20]KKP44910.1 MAG: 30S ribosomal protein S8 [Candidatus Woesebacteria bacterium GW2011_GWB1_33_22]KKP46724.1 MAG: 30S ribosomal protein S8 [Microgenomates group bacterium GW2011_GWC1_33_28]KKP50624.1 MAG: 30S ribosomal protein S8 [Candidatus Woesebacteria bacterium GW2011_GWA1_33_33]OGM07768.1 MAG: 30S ribosomal prote